MKRAIVKTLLQAVAILLVYSILLRLLAGTNIVAGIFCPGPHLPWHHPILIGLFLLCRLYVVMLPGLVLSRMGLAWMKRRQAGRDS
ncbi:MAG: hypothetical protein KAU94_06045 [Verrucomicrobia bacterium]|nr:hypothetical protein [Verrucomicrobiota bacterium]